MNTNYRSVLIAAATFFCSCSSCYIIKTYQIPAPSAQELAEANKKINSLLCVVNECSANNANYYVLNEKYLTIRMPRRKEKAMDQLIKYTFCGELSAASCGSIKLRLENFREKRNLSHSVNK